ncbi:MAG: hypothetical protein RSE56_04100 [Bacilli bacterium]
MTDKSNNKQEEQNSNDSKTVCTRAEESLHPVRPAPATNNDVNKTK